MIDSKEPSKEKQIIVYLGGGAMAGVYGAGVLKGLHDLNLTSCIKSIYSGSVGSLNAAYLLSGQVELGSTIYWENLQQNFIFPQNIFYGTLDLLINRFAKRLIAGEVRNVVDIDYAIKVMREIKPLNLEAILENPTELFIKVLNIRNEQLEYLRFKDFPSFDLIRAAICIKPYYYNISLINGNRYIDGTIKEPLGINYLLDQHLDRKVVVVLNEPIKRGVRHYCKNLTEGIVGNLYPYEISLFNLFLKREQSLRADIEICLKNRNVLLLYPDFTDRARPRTTSPTILKNTFNQGVVDSKKLTCSLTTDADIFRYASFCRSDIQNIQYDFEVYLWSFIFSLRGRGY